jgi:hypothetical protein
LLDLFAALQPKLTALHETPIAHASAASIYRPPKPPFHPPKQA